MATLKVYSREYGIKKVKEKVKFTTLELAVYTTMPICICLLVYIALNYNSKNYSLNHTYSENKLLINIMKNNNEEQRVLINNLSSYERVKDVAELLGMKDNKDNIKVVR